MSFNDYYCRCGEVMTFKKEDDIEEIIKEHYKQHETHLGNLTPEEDI